MNKNEKMMVQILKNLRDNYSVDGVKAEYEAEGTRTEELIRLKEIALATDVSLTLKIGGCEAIRDMYDARSIGVNHLLAPMVESAFALKKYLAAVDFVFPEDERQHIEFLINVETESTADIFCQMLEIPQLKKLNGIVVGRGDLVESMGFDRKQVDNDRSFKITERILIDAKEYGLITVVGGGITVESLHFLRRLPKGILDRYETRKICFACPGALGEMAPQGIELALEFELYWLSNKRNYYRTISQEDQKRITTLEQRLGQTVR